MAVLDSSMEGKSSQNNLHEKASLSLVQDINYARKLAANDENVRKKSLSYLKKYLEQRSNANSLTTENLVVIWKGLFYSMWMSDKPLVQEECAENIANLIHSLKFKESMLFFKIGLVTLQYEWIGIDQLRLNKFLMFVRRLLRQALFVLKNNDFKQSCNKIFAQVLEESILGIGKTQTLELFMHFTEIYLEELAKVSEGNLLPKRTIDFLMPYITKLAFATDNRVIKWIIKFIFIHLIKQHNLGLEYDEKYKVWKSQGFAGSINQIQKVFLTNEELADNEESDNEEPNEAAVNKPLDPRAGRVNVELPQIKFDAMEIAKALLNPKYDSSTSKITRNKLTAWSMKFQKLHNGIFPIGAKKCIFKHRKNLENYDTNPTKAAKRLIKFEQKLLARESNDKKRKRSEQGSRNRNSEIPLIKKKKHTNETYKNKDQVEKNLKKLKDKEKKNNKQPEKEDAKKAHHTKTQKNAKETCRNINMLEAKKVEMKKELKNKIKKKLGKREKANTTGSISDDDFNYCFERNSGVWFVTPEFVEKGLAPSPHDLKELDLVSKQDQLKDPKNGASPQSDNLSRSTQKTNPEMNSGEYEIFIPSRKYVGKLKKSKNKEQVEGIISKLRGKSSKLYLNSHSPRQSLIQFTPTEPQANRSLSQKKVKINTKLNVSQEIDEHILQVISSPEIPWDSSKKPGKPLLKTPTKTSPINPFYNLNTF